VFEGLRTVRGIIRSLRIYYGDSRRRRRWTVSMAVGAGAAIWCSISALMSATAWPRSGGSGRGSSPSEPQPALVKLLKLFYGRRADVAIEAVAIGRGVGAADMMINPDNPRSPPPRLSSSAPRAMRGAGNPALDRRLWCR